LDNITLNDGYTLFFLDLNEEQVKQHKNYSVTIWPPAEDLNPESPVHEAEEINTRQRRSEPHGGATHANSVGGTIRVLERYIVMCTQVNWTSHCKHNIQTQKPNSLMEIVS
jgi:hypothetical protein